MQRISHDSGFVAQNLSRNAFDAVRQFAGRAAREGHQQDPAWIGLVDDEMRYAMGEGIRLARSRSGNHQERRTDVAGHGHAVLNRTPLFRIERVQIGGGCHCQHESFPADPDKGVSSFGTIQERSVRVSGRCGAFG